MNGMAVLLDEVKVQLFLSSHLIYWDADCLFLYKRQLSVITKTYMAKMPTIYLHRELLMKQKLLR